MVTEDTHTHTVYKDTHIPGSKMKNYCRIPYFRCSPFHMVWREEMLKAADRRYTHTYIRDGHN